MKIKNALSYNIFKSQDTGDGSEQAVYFCIFFHQEPQAKPIPPGIYLATKPCFLWDKVPCMQ